MEWKDPVVRLYARIAGVEPTPAGDAQPNHSPLWIGTAVALSACFAVTLACGPASNDNVFIPASRTTKVQGGAGCDPGAGGQAGGDDTCSVATGTTGVNANTAASGTTCATATNAGGSTGSGGGTGSGQSGSTAGVVCPPVQLPG